jgi:TP901 family phage tail tape measure protein
MAFAETAKLAVQIDLGGNASAGLRGLQKQVNGLGSSVGRVGKGFGQIGAGVARAGLFVGGAAVAGLTGAAKAAIDFEDAFAGVVKTVDEADLAKAGLTFEDLSTAFREMATDIPITAVEFARLGEAAGALGVNAKDIETFVKTTAMLGVTTDLTADQAADSLGRIGTILDFTGKDYENFADSLVALGNAGASVESEIIEITKRFAAEGDAAGLATSEIAGLASAVASLGFAPERGGTALARVFANMGTDISLANKEGQAFAKTTGRSITDLQAALNRGEGLGIFLDVLESIRGLSATDANKVLASLGITNTSDRTIFRTMSAQLPFVNDQLEIAKNATGALLEEATKKFATTASKIQLFKNNIIEAGITVGEQFLPAVNRSLDAIISVLKDPTTKGDLKELGQGIGEAIDGIDWKQVVDGAKSFVGVLKGALDVTLAILKAANALPTELKAAAVAFLALNKVSGGLIGAGVGNVVGGIAETIVRGLGSKLPKVGSLFAQPVFVTNWPMGGLGGGAPAAAAGVGAGTLLAGAAVTAAAVAAVAVVQQQISRESSEHAAAIQSQTNQWLAHSPSRDQLVNGLNGVKQGITSITSNPLLTLVQGDALSTLQAMEGDISRQIAHIDQLRDQANRTKDDTVAAQNRTRDAALETKREAARGLSIVNTGVGRATAAAQETKRETSRGTAVVSAATRAVAPPIVSAIWAARPIVTTNVYVSGASVTKAQTSSKRTGSSGASRATDSNAARHE